MYQSNQSYNSYDPNLYQQQPAPAPEQPPAPKYRSMAGVLCACLLASTLAGFGGGYFAVTMSGGEEPAPTSQITSNGALSPTSAPIEQPVTQASGNAGVMTVSQVVNAVSDSVVEINTEVQATNFMRQTVTAQAAGSGVILSEDGYIITNNHVIDGAQSITVRLKNGESYPAALVGTDAKTDVAVIKIEADGLQAARIGSSSSLEVGDDAIAIGNPLGELGGTVTNGIISATSRDVTIDGDTMTLLQTNAAINQGNSGGGLFNNQGELIGIVVAKSSGVGVEGLGFAIPIDTAIQAANDLIEHGYVTGRGELGITVMNITDPREALMYRLPQTGLYVAAVSNGSAAQQAGLKVGDCILAVDGTEIAASSDLSAQLGKHHSGDQVSLRILRDGQETTITVTLQEAIPESVKQNSVPA